MNEEIKKSKIRVGIFSNTLHHGCLRGANRLFHEIYDELKTHDDLQIILLDSKVPYEISPNGTLYYGRDLSDPEVLKKSETNKRISLEEILLFVNKINRGIRRLRSHYKRIVPRAIRAVFAPITYISYRVYCRIYNYTEEKLNAIYVPLARRGMERLTIRELVVALFFPPPSSFSNDDIIADAFSIRELDIILNFWWFHLPFESPIISIVVPENVIVYSWFLDASPLRIPHWQEGLINETQFHKGLHPHLNASDRIIAISHSAAEDANLFFGVDKEKTIVVPCGVNEKDFATNNNDEQNAEVFKNLGLNIEKTTIMVLGVQEPTKNVVNILKALYLLAKKDKRFIQCVFVGAHHGFSPVQKFGAIIEKMPANMHLLFTGSIAETDKRILMSKSSLLLYPSIWEGFGIPPLEAMAAGVPVVTSDVASLPEVCEEHAFYCDPYDPADMSEKISFVLNMTESEKSSHTKSAKEYARGWLYSKKAIPMLVADMKRQFNKTLIQVRSA